MIKWLNNRKKFSTKIIALLIFLSLGALILYGSISLWINITTLKTTLREVNENYTQWAAREIYSYIESNLEILRSIGSILGKANLTPYQQENTMRQILVNTKNFNYIYMVDTYGKIFISTNTRSNESDFSKNPLFQQGKIQETISPDVTIDERSSFPQLTVALPISSLNELKGVLIASIDLRRMCEIIESIKIGETGKALVVDENGMVIAHPDLEYVVNKKKINNIFLKEFKKSKNIHFYKRVDFNGKKVIGTNTPIKNLNWNVIFEINSSEAFAPARRIVAASIVLISLAIGVSFWIGFRFTKILLAPIINLSNAMKRLAKGDSSVTIPITTKDELGLLADGFNRMSNELEVKEQKLRNIQNELKHSERLSTIGTISSKILHEIRTPLFSLKLNLKCLLENNRSNDEKKEATLNINKLIDRTEDITNNLLQFSQKRKINLQSYNISEIFGELKILFNNQSHKENVVINFPEQTNLPNIIADKSLTIQVFSNLIRNSIEAMPSGGQVNITYYIKDEFLVTGIQDNGEGISEEDILHIFDLFYTNKKNGTGLGLAIVKQALKDLDGKIEIQSKKGKGTTCLVYFPIDRNNSFKNDN